MGSRSESGLHPVVTVVISCVLSGLIAFAVASYQSDKAESGRVDDRRTEAYSSVAKAYNHFKGDLDDNKAALGLLVRNAQDAAKTPALNDFSTKNYGTRTPKEALALVQTDFQALRDAVSALDIVGSSRASAEAWKVQQTAWTVVVMLPFTQTLSPTYDLGLENAQRVAKDAKAWKKLIVELDVVYLGFLDAARADLG